MDMSEEYLNLILPKDYILYNGENSHFNESVVVIIHLYYDDQIDKYLKYIYNIPENVDIIFTVSDKKIQIILETVLSGKRKNYKFIYKENRGRDISALLVACREEVLKYNIVCFLHDKKAINSQLEKDTEEWIYCLWENTIGSTEYINNVIGSFMTNPKLGLLTPPAPLTENLTYAYGNTWGENFENTKELAEYMHLDCEMNEGQQPTALGMVFWARTEALLKLFNITWNYTDFEPEPLKIDGTLSHAIERILPYVVQDAGFVTGKIFTDMYVQEKICFGESILRVVFSILQDVCGVSRISEAKKIVKQIEEIKIFGSKFKHLYIYGAGYYGRVCFRRMLDLGIPIDAFLESTTDSEQKVLYEIPVKCIDDISLDDKTGIIVAVSAQYDNEIQMELCIRHIQDKQIYYWKNI